MSRDVIFPQLSGKRMIDFRKDADCTEQVPYTQYVVEGKTVDTIHNSIFYALDKFYHEYNQYPKILMLNKQGYGALCINNHNGFTQIHFMDRFENMTVICDPSQKDLVRVLAEPEMAFKYSADVSFDPHTKELSLMKQENAKLQLECRKFQDTLQREKESSAEYLSIAKRWKEKYAKQEKGMIRLAENFRAARSSESKLKDRIVDLSIALIAALLFAAAFIWKYTEVMK